MLVEPLLVGDAQRVADLHRGRGLDALARLGDADRALLDARARQRHERGAVVEPHEHPLGHAGRLVEEDQVDGAEALVVRADDVAPGPGTEVVEVALCREIGHGLHAYRAAARTKP